MWTYALRLRCVGLIWLVAMTLLSGCGSREFSGQYQSKLMKDGDSWGVEQTLVNGNQVYVMKVTNKARFNKRMLKRPNTDSVMDGVQVGSKVIFLERGAWYTIAGKKEKEIIKDGQTRYYINVDRIAPQR